MEEETKLKYLEGLIEEGKFIKLHDFVKTETNAVIQELTSAKYLDITENSNHENIKSIIISYENDMSLLIKMLAILCRFRGDKHFDLINELVDRFLNMERNENAEYGYIWRHISNYSLLLVTYCLGISFLRNNNLEDFHELLNKQIIQRYAGRDNVEYFKTTLIEGINAYHLFNGIDHISVDVYQFLPVIGETDPNRQTQTQKRLNANERIYEYLSTRMSLYFRDLKDFSDYFDLYEFFTGVFCMEKRLEESHKFAPYGRNYRMYSGAGRYFVVKDTLVQNYMNDIINNNNDILKVGFFNGKGERFKEAHNEYVSLLSAISNSRG